MSDRTTPADLSPEQKRALLARLLREKVDREAVFPLSHGQKALWLLYRLAPTSAAYNVAFTATLRGLDVPSLRGSLGTLVERHEVLRVAVLDRDGNPVQRVAARLDAVLEEVEASTWSVDELRSRLVESYRRPFDLEQGPVFRASLYRRSPGEHVLLFVVHHLVVDAWSIGLLVNEWLALYAARRHDAPSPLAPLSVRYADFVRWQEEFVDGAEGSETLAYWRRQLRGPLPALQMPTDRPRPAFPSFRGGTHELRIDAATTGALRELARGQGTTLFSVLLAVFHVLLFRYSGQNDVLVGSPTAGRSHQDFEGLVGYFVNPVVLRGDLSGDPSFLEVVRRTRATVIDALRHADYPFPLVVQHLNPERDASRSPLFQAEFNLVKMQQLGVGGDAAASGAASVGTLAGLWLESFALPQQEGQFDLTFEVVDLGTDLLANLKYSTDLFDASTIERMEGHLQTLLRGIVADPAVRIADLPLLTDAERASIERWNATERRYPLDRRLHQLIEEQVARTPDAVAVQAEGGRLSYRELDARANQLGRHLRHLGVGPEVLVGIAMERSLEMVVALLGVLKAGGGYVPLDPTYPSERLSFMMDDARVPVLLTQPHLREALPASAAEVVALGSDWRVLAAESPEPLEAVGTSQNLAYVIYTSGSTGRPKGAMNEHRGIVNRLLWMQEQYGLGADDVVLQKTPFSFDVSVWELFWPLLAGARLVMARPEGHKDPSYLVRTIVDEHVTTIHFVPPMLQVFLEEPGAGACASLRRVICSGEALPKELCARFFETLSCELHNLYGPTEAAVDVTHFPCRPDAGRSGVPIGRPVANTRVHVLGPNLEALPIGVAGELHLGGVQVGRGYLGRPDLTAERFVPDPFADQAGGRLYRTGDLARLLPDGNVDYLGRMDYQVKIRGFRVELGEIESALADCPGVDQAVVLVQEVAGDRRLAAYLTSSGGRLETAALRDSLGARLPQHMVPSSFVFLDALPLTPNGKVDRQALARIESTSTVARGEHVAPRTATQQRVASIWEETLGASALGIHDDFFVVGGHSLGAARIIARLRAAFGVEVGLRSLFERPTIAGLAETIDILLLARGAAAAAEGSGDREEFEL